MPAAGPGPEMLHLVLATFLVACLWAYRRYDWRLGGLLVIPVLVLYAVLDGRLLVAFFVGGLATYGFGRHVLARHRLGPRASAALHLGAGALVTLAALWALGLAANALTLAVLPGVFALDLHRYPDALKGLARFAALLVPAYALAAIAAGIVGPFEPPPLVAHEGASWLSATGRVVPSWMAAPSALDGLGLGVAAAELATAEPRSTA